MEVSLDKLKTAFNIARKSDETVWDDIIALLKQPVQPVSREWGNEDTELLIQLYKDNHPINAIAEILNKTESSVTNKINRLRKQGGLNQGGLNQRITWTEEKEKELIELYQKGLSYSEMAEKVGVSEQSISAKITRLFKANKLQKRQSASENYLTLTDEKEKMLTMRNNGCTYDDIAKEFGQPTNTVYDKIQAFNTSRATNRHKRWTTEELEELMRLKQQNYTATQVAQKMNRSYKSVRQKYKELNTAKMIQQTESHKHKKIRLFLMEHDNDLDKILSVDYTNLANELMMNRDKCVAMVYDVWKEGKVNV